jgi:hypothetical protein
MEDSPNSSPKLKKSKISDAEKREREKIKNEKFGFESISLKRFTDFINQEFKPKKADYGRML